MRKKKKTWEGFIMSKLVFPIRFLVKQVPTFEFLNINYCNKLDFIRKKLMINREIISTSQTFKINESLC